MQHWLSDTEFIYNDRRNGQFVALIRDIEGRELTCLPRPIYAVAPDGHTALTLNFSRLARTRPGYGYAGVPDATAHALCPEDDGIWRIDLVSGAVDLVISVGTIARFEPQRGMHGAEHWCNHPTYSPQGGRFVFLHRWRTPRKSGLAGTLAQQPRTGWGKRARKTLGRLYRGMTGRRFTGHQSRMLVANADGTGLRCVLGEGMVSHFSWRDENHLLVWCHRRPAGDRYWLLNVETGHAEIAGDGILARDGHCTYSPDGKWILTDTYPDADGYQTLILFDPRNERRMDVGRYQAQPDLTGEIRCDLHPRFDRTGSRVCFDSAHEGARQMYCLDVSEITQC